MKIAINATCLNDRPSGAKQRFIGIYGALFRQLEHAEFTIFEPSDCKVTDWFNEQPNLRAEQTPIPSLGRFVKLAVGISYWQNNLAKKNYHVFESMHLPLVKYPNGANVLTIHDLRGLDLNNNYFSRKIYSKFLRSALFQADHVITVSHAMKSEILNFFPHKSISVVYNGLNYDDFNVISTTDCNNFQSSYSLPSNYLLAVGHLEYRKNYYRLISALHYLSKRGIDSPLVIIGNDSGEELRLIEHIYNLGLQNRVFILKGLSDLEVKCAYALSSLVIFPSLYEGFGIPILEAMASSKPMVLSNIPVFNEVTEGSCIYFQPNDIDSMCDAIESVLSSPELQRKIINYGNNRVKDFGFEVLANSLSFIYKDFGK